MAPLTRRRGGGAWLFFIKCISNVDFYQQPTLDPQLVNGGGGRGRSQPSIRRAWAQSRGGAAPGLTGALSVPRVFVHLHIDAGEKPLDTSPWGFSLPLMWVNLFHISWFLDLLEA